MNASEQCNCENLQCGNCGGNGCHNEAGQQKVLYVGLVCDDCVSSVSPRFLIPSDYEACGECGFDHEYEAASAHDAHLSDLPTEGEPSCGSVCGCEDCNPIQSSESRCAYGCHCAKCNPPEPFDFDAYNNRLPKRK